MSFRTLGLGFGKFGVQILIFESGRFRAQSLQNGLWSRVLEQVHSLAPKS